MAADDHEGRDERADHDGVTTDDAQLRQLRAVWLSMRDEEPSDRGLSALMTAARAQAATMTPHETWWQRAWMALRRPPVLAFASVAVLLGGALVLNHRRDEVQVVATAQDGAAAMDRAPVGAPPVGASSVGSSQEAARHDEAPRGEFGQEGLARPAAPAPPPRVVPASRTPRQPGATGTMAIAQDKGRSVEEAVDVERSGGGAATTVDAVPLDDQDEKAPVARPTIGRRTPPPIHGEPTAPRPQHPAPELEASSDAVTKHDDASSIAQLLAQCEAAAERGDCLRVRALAKTILARDAAIYKQRVASRPAIARCLAR